MGVADPAEAARSQLGRALAGRIAQVRNGLMGWAVAVDDIVPVAERLGSPVSTIVRQGLKLLIDSQPDMSVVGESADGKGVLDQASALKPDIVVMDISMPGMNGLVATRTLKGAQPDVTIVALTRHDDDT